MRAVVRALSRVLVGTLGWYLAVFALLPSGSPGGQWTFLVLGAALLWWAARPTNQD